jgi:FtsP/CotA-like multicopper oxidase with cupredoxin domain
MSGWHRRDILKSLGVAAVGHAAARWDPRWDAAQAFVPDVELTLTAAPAEAAILPGARTKVWSYTGRVVKGPASALQPIPNSYLGPTIRLTRGQKVRIRFNNRLPDASIVHWHGLDVPQEADGHPRLAVPAGAGYVYEFEVTNRAGTYWYHPHPHMQTGPQVYSGLAGLLIVRDDEETAVGLPSGAQELTWVLQDRRFDGSNQLVYSTAMMDMETGFLGNRVLVNGREKPAFALATRAYRLRVLNGSNARIYKLGWSDGTPISVIGVDGGLLERPRSQPHVTLAPAQRVDIWLDLSQRPIGSTLELRSAAFELADAGLAMGGRGMGMMGGAMAGGRGGVMSGGAAPLPLGAAIPLATVRVARKEAGVARLPDRLSTFDRTWSPDAGLPVRSVPLTFQMMQWFMAGRTFDMTDVAADEVVAAGSTHVWEFVNAGGPMGMQMAHPIHLHGRQFRVLSRTGGSPTNTLRDGLVDGGWTDTVLVLPQERVRVQITFSRHPGLFLYHCHILEHEDMGMMRNFRIR